jgi:hypothetical protein
MSAKEALIEWIRHLPDDLSLAQIFSALERQYGLRLDYEWPTADLTDDEWRQVVARTWQESLEDPRDDIYTLEDGKPEMDRSKQDEQ